MRARKSTDVTKIPSEELFLGPLLRETSGRHDEDLLDDPTEEKLLDQEPCHDRLAGAGFVRQEEPDPWQRQQEAVDRLHLMGQRVDDARVDREQRVELMSDADALRLGTKQEGRGVAVEGMGAASHLRQRRELLVGQRPANLPAGRRADALDEHLAPEGRDTLDLDELARLEACHHVARLEVLGV